MPLSNDNARGTFRPAAFFCALLFLVSCGGRREPNPPIQVTIVRVAVEKGGALYCEGEKVSWRGLRKELKGFVDRYEHVAVAAVVDLSIPPDDAKAYLEKVARNAEIAGVEAISGGYPVE